MKNQKHTALIADSDYSAVTKLTNILYRMNSIGLVLHASSYKEAEEILKSNNVSILFSEVKIPGSNGMALLKILHRKKQEVRIIMLSNQANSYYRDLCTSLGATYFFDKSDTLEKIPMILYQLELNEENRETNRKLTMSN
jgi:DNA-binding NtrC family response regulator